MRREDDVELDVEVLLEDEVNDDVELLVDDELLTHRPTSEVTVMSGGSQSLPLLLLSLGETS